MKAEILSFLPPDFPWRSRILCYDSVESTNTMAKAMVLQGAPAGTVLIAEEQTGGRGRLGRTFQSPGHMGVYMSVILRPDCLPSELMHLTCAAAVAMCDAVQVSAGFRPGVKWTNDLVYGTRKLAGILTELVIDPGTGRVAGAVVGIGINCLQKPQDFSPELQDMAASLQMIAAEDVSRPRVAAQMILALSRMNDCLIAEKSRIMAQYRRDCITLNREISLVRGDEIRHGTAVDIDEDGALIVAFSSGTREAVSSGEISIRGMYGYV